MNEEVNDDSEEEGDIRQAPVYPTKQAKDGDSRDSKSRRRNCYCDPPAIEGTSSTSSPSWNECEAPPRKRISSSFT